jgi:glycine/D-amino acid oxidase-like deaminating enzyme
MDLRSHYPYWLLKNGIVREYPSLWENLSTDVVIMGAGISGALVAWQLSKEGCPLIVLDKRHVAMGSTAASTSLLQYEIDTPLHELQQIVGKENAIQSYLLCRQSIYELKEISTELTVDVGFSLRSSFQFASRASHLKKLEAEYQARRTAGIETALFNARDTKKLYHLDKAGGLYSKDAGQVDAYKMTHAILDQVEKRGNRVLDLSPVTQIKHLKRGVELRVGNKHTIKARKLVIACGYESQQYLTKKIERLASTYAIISEPFDRSEFWFENSLIWETAAPYLYLKTTQDYRVLIGGKDVPFYNPNKRDKLIGSKARQLEKSFVRLFPKLSFKTDFEWAGTYSHTKDGLPYIGSIPERPHTFFALGYGGNGITFSQIAARIISDQLMGRKNVHGDIFSFNR